MYMWRLYSQTMFYLLSISIEYICFPLYCLPQLQRAGMYAVETQASVAMRHVHLEDIAFAACAQLDMTMIRLSKDAKVGHQCREFYQTLLPPKQMNVHVV